MSVTFIPHRAAGDALLCPTLLIYCNCVCVYVCVCVIVCVFVCDCVCVCVCVCVYTAGDALLCPILLTYCNCVCVCACVCTRQVMLYFVNHIASSPRSAHGTYVTTTIFWT